ncbi:SMP-30/gluconolactonase/LRE family protein [Paludibaculum fermentans]|uniref:SMP-30/gluconolactonase/LRE family protein n=1 Tax=Paludibaculum fermentans TaxID=1473598 RepID=A0A7S7NNI5_PALFE|nr:SMP-30/gluconolactonase/LRE family protein [Paludibaculum fermentans]QOY86384.1 SMP-30/gluconolactonase/LRE family protein [Paludibaculum fermentans]
MVRCLAFMALCAALCGAQELGEYKVERAGSGFRFLEGPVWSKDGHVIFSDTSTNKIHRYTPTKGMELLRENAGGPSGNALDERGRLITCEQGRRRVVRSNAKGEVDILAEKFEGKRLNAPNDVTVRKDGHIFFTDPAFGKDDDAKELPFYGVFHITPKGELSVVGRWPKRPNGIALSPNGHILYVTGADERVVRAYDLDRQGVATNERVLITGIQGVPGGIRTDEKGNLYIACKGVAIYSPEGKLLRNLEISENPSNLAFGDADLKTLYVTARTTLYRVRLDVKGSAQIE